MQQPDLQNLFSYFRNSMSYLLQEGEEFGQKYPSIAKELNFSSNKISDPHVKRILEAFAFFDARLQYQIDDQMSDMSYHLLNALYPQFTSPIPSCTIVKFDKIKKITHFKEITIPKSTQITTKNSNNHQCTFSTSYDLKLTNLEITKTSYVKEDQTNLKMDHDFALSLKVKNLKANQKVNLFINSDFFSSLSLYENILAYYPFKPTPIFLSNLKNELVQNSPIGYVYPKGFNENENLFNNPQYCNDIHRVLLEYSCFPEKFFFIRFEFNDFKFNEGEHKLLIPLSPNTNPKIMHLHQNILETNCTPAINLFNKTSEPLTLNYQSEKYKLLANSNEENFEIHSINSVFQYDPNQKDNKLEYNPYFGFYNYDINFDKYWYSMREKSKIGGSHMYISFVDPSMNVLDLKNQTIYADITCTNRSQASLVKVNSDFQVKKIDGISCLNITQPTSSINTEQMGKNQWNIISNLALNHIDLSLNNKNIQTLQKILEIYNLRKNIKQHSKSIIKLDFHQSIGRHPNTPWEGSVPKIIFDLTLDNYTPEIFLLGMLLSHILSQCTPFNTLVDVNLYSLSNKKIWKSMSSLK